MSSKDDVEFERVSEELSRRQRRPVAPRRIADVLSHLMARHGYAQSQSSREWEAAWREAVGAAVAEHSQVGRLRRGVLEVIVRNSSVLQELTFRKKKLLTSLKTCPLADKIIDLRFRVGELD